MNLISPSELHSHRLQISTKKSTTTCKRIIGLCATTVCSWICKSIVYLFLNNFLMAIPSLKQKGEKIMPSMLLLEYNFQSLQYGGPHGPLILKCKRVSLHYFFLDTWYAFNVLTRKCIWLLDLTFLLKHFVYQISKKIHSFT